MKLNQEEIEIIRDIKEANQWDVIERLCEIGIKEAESRLLALTDFNEREIFIRKVKLEGAKELARMILETPGKVKRSKS